MRSGPLQVLAVIGTRPEGIKMAPVVRALREEPWCRVRVLATAQHREMLDQVLTTFGIVPDADLDIMTADQALSPLAARLLTGVDDALVREQPDLVLVQGDTTTVLSTAIACFHRRVPFGHVEAGLRTHDFDNPFPEEMNRVVADRLATFHFAPTEGARRHLQDEGIAPDRIHVTGNTVIDALLQVAARDGGTEFELAPDKRLLLVTAHRRESFGAPFIELCEALAAIADKFADVQILYAVHPNPNVQTVVRAKLAGHPRVRLCGPLMYEPFVAALKRSYLVLTDSGGVQEEAPALGKPVLVLRDETERPEAVEAGVAKLIGMRARGIIDETIRLLEDNSAYAAMAKGASPYGDGHAAERIVGIIRNSFNVSAAGRQNAGVIY